MAKPVVWPASEAECSRAGAVLARAFIRERLVIACYPPPMPDLELLAKRFSASLRYACRVGQVWAIGTSKDDIADGCHGLPRTCGAAAA